MKKFLMVLWIILAVLCFIYGITVAKVRSGTSFFVVWFAMGIVFLGFSAIVKFDIWMKTPVIARDGFCAIIVIGLLTFLIFEGFVLSEFSKNGKENLDYIIVLGAQVRKSGPSVALEYRLNKAVEYLENNSDTKCIVSGGKGINEPYAEAVGMANYLIENGIDETRIILETKSRTTEENIIFSKKLMEKDASAGIVTNDFHMFRALQIARKRGLGQVYGISAGSTRLYLANNMLREYFAEIKFLLFRNWE